MPQQIPYTPEEIAADRSVDEATKLQLLRQYYPQIAAEYERGSAPASTPPKGAFSRFAEPFVAAGEGIVKSLSNVGQVPGAMRDLISRSEESIPGSGVSGVGPAARFGSQFLKDVIQSGEEAARGQLERPRGSSYVPEGPLRDTTAAIASVPVFGAPVAEMISKVAEGNFAGAVGEAMLLAGPQALRAPAAAMLNKAKATVNSASGPLRDMARSVGLKPRKLLDPLGGVSGDPGVAMRGLREIGNRELAAAGVPGVIPEEITTAAAMRDFINDAFKKHNVAAEDSATFTKNVIGHERDSVLSKIDTETEGQLSSAKAATDAKLAGIAERARVRSTQVIPKEMERVGGVSPISSAEAGRSLVPEIKNSKQAASDIYGGQMETAEAALSTNLVPRSRLESSIADFPEGLDPKIDYLRNAIRGGEDIPPEIMPFSEIRTLNRRLGKVKDPVLQTANKSVEDAALRHIKKTNPDEVEAFQTAVREYNTNFAAPYRRGAPGRAIKAGKTEMPQNVTNIPLTATEQWAMMDKAVGGNPAARRALTSDVVYNRMGFSKGGASKFAETWRTTPPEVRSIIFKEAAPAIDNFLNTIESLEKGTQAVTAATKATGAETVANIKGIKARRVEDIKTRYQGEIEGVKPKYAPRSLDMVTLDQILSEYRPKGFAVDPKLNIWNGRTFGVRITDTMAHILGAGDVQSALNFAKAFDTFTKTGRPQGIVNTIAAIQRVERQKNKQTQEEPQ